MTKNILNSRKNYITYLILHEIIQNSCLTQRDLAHVTGVAISSINKHLEQYENEELINRHYLTSKTILYYCTAKGTDYYNKLKIEHIQSITLFHEQIIRHNVTFIKKLIEKNISNVIIMGTEEELDAIFFFMTKIYNGQINILGYITDKTMAFNQLKQLSHSDLMNKSYDAIIQFSGTPLTLSLQHLSSEALIREKIIEL